MSKTLRELVDDLLKCSTVREFTTHPHVNRHEVSTYEEAASGKRRYVPGYTSVTVSVTLEVTDHDAARLLLPGTYDIIDRTIAEMNP